MITQSQIVDAVHIAPQARALGDRNYWKNIVSNLLPVVLTRIATSHSFDFVMNSQSFTWTANEQGVALHGVNEDLLEVVSLKHGTTVLQKMRKADAIDVLSNGNSLGGVKMWYQDGVDNDGFPKITLADLPSEDETVVIDYRRKNIELSQWPDDFAWVIVSGLMYQIGAISKPAYQSDIKDMVRLYKRGGKDYTIAGLDPQILQANQQVNSNYRSN